MALGDVLLYSDLAIIHGPCRRCVAGEAATPVRVTPRLLHLRGTHQPATPDVPLV
jgi:hypothetical protein